VIIRTASVKDVLSIGKLYEDFWKFNSSQQPYYYAEAKESGQYPQSVIDGTTGDIFVAENDDGEIIGFIHIEEEKTLPYAAIVQHRFACIVDFFVLPEHRKRGVGKSLLEKSKEWSLSRELDYIEMFVLEENEIGKKFYKRENFKTTSQTMRYILSSS
jgi:ribosomal protein S18 acetylase RimI-like enzyme